MGSKPHTQLGRKALYSAYLEILKAETLWQSDSNTAMQFVVGECVKALHASRVGVWRFNKTRENLYCQILYDNGTFQLEPTLAIQASLHPEYFNAIEKTRVIAADNATHHPATQTFEQTYLRPFDIHSILDATILKGGKTTGILCIEQTKSTRTWSIAEQNFSIAIADILSQIFMASKLSHTRERYQKVFNATTDAVLLMQDRHLVDCNEAALQMFGCTREEYYQQQATRFWPETQSDGTNSKEKARMFFQRCTQTGKPLRFEWKHRRFDGKEFDSEVDLNQIYLNNKAHVTISIRDITERKAFEKHIQNLLSLQQAIFDGANYSIISTDLDGLILSFNRAAQNLLGYHSTEVIQQITPIQFHDTEELNLRATELKDHLNTTIEPGFDVLTALTQNGKTEEREWTYTHKDGHRIPVLVSVTALHQGGSEITGYLCIASDISARKKSAEALLQSQREMEYKTHHDDLTGLPNRLCLHNDAVDLIKNASHQKCLLALLLIDLNRFKEVNDTLGHSTGDELIKLIAERLSTRLSPSGASLYRLGGDEFTVVVPKATCTKEIDTLVNNVHKTLRESISIEDIHIEMSGSIGIAVYPHNGKDSHSLLRCADVAMYKAKAASAETMYYQPEADGHSTRRLAMMSELGNAMRSNQLTLHYQPRIAIDKKLCIGCEALIRWNHPKLGMIPPVEFIPLAEVSDHIRPLGYWVLQSALKQTREWLDKGLGMVVSVNLSTRNLMDVTIPEQIATLLNQTNVPPQYLEVEITESTLIDDPERALQVIDRIHSLGVRFAIDDFGTGYSSLSYLKKLPIDTLKIDRSFIKDMLTDEQDSVIVRSTLHLAHSFGLEVVAEGVEDKETLAVLKALQCEQVQGYFYSKPLPAPEFEQWLQAFKR